MASPSPRTRPPSPEHTTTPAERVIDVSSDSPALLRTISGDDTVPDDEDDALDEEEDDDHDDSTLSTLTELELTEHEYHRGRQAIPMQSPGDMDMDPEVSGIGREGRRRRQLPSLRKRHFFFEGNDVTFARPSRGGRMMQRITLRRRKAGEQDGFWTWIFLSNILSLAVMIVLMFYLLQTDFFESHQNELFGTTVDNRFTVVAPENADAKIYMKSGYSTSRYSEAMLSFGNGELKIGRRALAPTDAQGFYGVSIANNGSTTFTNKLNAPFMKTDYLHAVRAVVFDDGTVMTTAANLSGGINEVGDLNLVSKTGAITLSAGGKPVIKIDPDATVNLLSPGADDMEATGITFGAASGDISVASTFKIHHDENSTVIASHNSIEVNSTKLVIGSTNATQTVITVPGASNTETFTNAPHYKKITLAVMGQTSDNQSHGGGILICGGDGTTRGGDVVLTGGESSENEDGDVTRGSVLINAKLDRTTVSTTEIGSHSKSHQVNLHGRVSINNASESGHGTSLYIGGGNVLAHSKNVTIDNIATNGSSVSIKTQHIGLQATAASLVMGANTTSLVGSKKLVISIAPEINSSHSSILSMDNSGRLEVNASRVISLHTAGANSSINVFGTVRFGSDSQIDNKTSSDVFMEIEDEALTIDTESVVVGGAGNTDDISFIADEITIGNSSQTSYVYISGENASIASKYLNIGASVSNVMVAGKIVDLRASDGSKAGSLSLWGGSVSLSGSDLVIGDNNSQTLVLGSPSTGHTSIMAEALEIGTSSKTVSIGDKATKLKIGSDSSSIDIQGKLTINGKAFEGSRRLHASDPTFFAIAQSNDVVLQFPDSNNEIHVPVSVIVNSKGSITNPSGDVQLVDSSATHMRLGLSLTGVRMRGDSSVANTESNRLGRPPKLRCRLYTTHGTASALLEVVSQLETCDDDEDCRDGFFHGASVQRLVAIQVRDRLSLKCSVGPRTVGTHTVLIDSIQLDVSSL